MRKTIALAALALAGCINRPVVSTPPADCASLVPAGWHDGVEAAPVPENAPVQLGQPLTAATVAAIIGPWASAYVVMSGMLEKANGRTADAIDIVKRCETLVNKARPNN